MTLENLKRFIDVARPSMDMKQILDAINSKTTVYSKGKGGAPTKYKDGLKYEKDLSELIFPYVD